MFGNAFTGWHALILLAIILLLFGAPKLPGLARSLGQSMKIFKNEIKSPEADKRSNEPAGNVDFDNGASPSASDGPTPDASNQPKP